MKIGIYGGTFDPMHLGHLEAARAAMDQLGLRRMFFVPAGLPPHKCLDAHTPPPRQRLELAKLGAEYLERDAVVLDLEMRREGKSYTRDTVRQLHRRYPNDQLFLLTGSDMFLTFQNWRGPQDILRYCTLVGFRRSTSDDRERLAAQREFLSKRFHREVLLIDLPGVVDVSSTQIREMLPQGGGRDCLPPAVYGCILRHNLYGTNADLRNLPLEDLRCAAVSMLKHRRIPHVLGTESTALALARRWGANINDTLRAALLHDCTKKLSREQHMALCRQYHIPLDRRERQDEHLLHAVTGAAVAEHVYGLSPDAVSAIRWHTTGRENMSLLEKIIYLADYIEPTRDFCGLSELRSLAFQDLDSAMLLGLEMSVRDLKKRGMRVDPYSVRARDYLKGTLT